MPRLGVITSTLRNDSIYQSPKCMKTKVRFIKQHVPKPLGIRRNATVQRVNIQYG